MKRNFLFFGMLLLFLCNANTLLAQKKNKELKVKKRTLMERYEPDMVLSTEERLQLKKERLALIEERKSIIDTLEISDRKRRKLLKELYQSPFSNRWDRVIADLGFEETPED